MEEVRRSVEGIDDPAPPARAPSLGALLTENTVVGAVLAQQRVEPCLGLAIGIRDEVGVRGLRLEPTRRAAVEGEQQLPRLGREQLG